MYPLQRLVLDQMRDRGWSPKQVEDRGVKHATLHRYMNPLVLRGLPRQESLKQLADALDLDFERVLQAAKDSVGWDARRADSVGPRTQDDPDEIVFRLKVPPNATQAQRDMARRAAQASARAVLAELDEE
jgi:hypothetical protein